MPVIRGKDVVVLLIDDVRSLLGVIPWTLEDIKRYQDSGVLRIIDELKTVVKQDDQENG